MDLPQAFEFSRYASRLKTARPAVVGSVLEALDSPFSFAASETEVIADHDPVSLAAALRQLRQRAVLTAMFRDLTGRADLGEVMQTMTRLAEIAVRRAVVAHHRGLVEAHGEPLGAGSASRQQLIVVGMGKLGGCELNVSSDIDLVFVYPEEGSTAGPKVLANQEFFDRLGRRVIAALGDSTAEGFVFRVDMRLRPYGDGGPLSSSFAALEHYLITQGRTWERYAWMKARALTGDRCADLDRLIAPFVFRKYLDYDAYAGLRDVHRQIREQGRRRDYARNVKLGPGGIREIEFIVQALQMVRGGREPALRVRPTLVALDALRVRGTLPAAVVDELRDAYVFLRNVEHRLQYRDDTQTHDLPSEPTELDLLAQACGFADAVSFEAGVHDRRESVERHFDALFGPSDAAGADALVSIWIDPSPDEAHDAALRVAGYADPAALIATLARLRESSRYLQLPILSRQRFDALVPQLLRAAADTPEPQAVFLRLLTLLDAISGRSVYLALLVEHPPVLPRLAHLMAASAWAAEYLTRHPILLDELLDSRALLAEPSWDEWRKELSAQLSAHAGDAERQIDVLRHFQHAQTFRLLAQDLEGRLSIERLADHLSALADIILDATLELCWIQMQGPDAAPPKFAIIGYGKLGGKELGYASDLDVVFLYDDPDDAASQRYARLAQRINTALTSLTAAGRLYDTDLRLRPDGAKGLMVSSLEAFRTYQADQAWTWEHQALTRARFVAGDERIEHAFDAEREAILRMNRDHARLRDDIVAMRRRMYAAHPNRSALFDLKHDPGGMVDIEFAVQYLILAHSHAWRELTRNIGNIALLSQCAGLGLVDPETAAASAAAYREYRRLQHQVRLQGAHEARVEPGPQAPRRDAVASLWAAVFGASWAEATSQIS